MSEDVVNLLAAVFGGGALGQAARIGWSAWQSRGESRRADVEADASVRAAEVIADERVRIELIRGEQGEAQRLWQRLEVVEEAQRKSEAAQRECEEQRRQDREQCDREIQAVRDEVRTEVARARAEMSRVTHLLAERWRDEGLDDTGVHEVEAISARGSTPPGEYALGPLDPEET